MNDRSQALDESQRLRDRILGLNLRLAREAAGRSIRDCASHLQMPPETVGAWEIGDGHPSLPQLERLAGYLNVPFEELMPAQAAAAERASESDRSEFRVLRQRIVGGLLRAAREAKGWEIEQLSAAAAIDVELLAAYELGECAVPMDRLSVLAAALGRDLAYFEEAETTPDSLSEYLAELPSDVDIADALQQLADARQAEGFVKLAAAFSRIPGDELRRIADALLAISAAKSRQNGA